MQIYHNPRCRKSRETLALLQEKGHQPEIIRYLETVPTEKELRTVLHKLGIPAADLVRQGEALYKEKFRGRELTEAEWITALVEHPRLIERPIVIRGDRAVIGRPPARVLDLL